MKKGVENDIFWFEIGSRFGMVEGYSSNICMC